MLPCWTASLRGKRALNTIDELYCEVIMKNAVEKVKVSCVQKGVERLKSDFKN